MKKISFTLIVILITTFSVCSYAEKDEHSFTITEAGKHGPITFVISVSQDGSITDIAILESKEVKGAKIGRKRFLKQFIGKSLEDALKIGKDIDSVTGATVTSNVAIRSAKKALILWKEQCD